MKSLKDLTAIKPRGYTLIEASAGTGKTFTITGIYLRLVMEEGLEPEQILVVTFTNAATEELRTKIRTRLDDALEYLDTGKAVDEVLIGVVDHAVSVARGGRDEVRRRLRSAALGMDQAAVFTIHGFCQRVLKEFSFEAGALTGTRDVIMDQELHLPACREFVRSRIAGMDGLFLPLVIELYGAENMAEELAARLKSLLSLPEPVILPEVDMKSIRRELEIFKKCQEENKDAGREIGDVINAAVTGWATELVDTLCHALSEEYQDKFPKEAKKWIKAQVQKELRAFDFIFSEPLPKIDKFREAAGSLFFALGAEDPRPRSLWLFEIFQARVVSQQMAGKSTSRGKMVVDDLSFARYTRALRRWLCECHGNDLPKKTVETARQAANGIISLLFHAGIRERADAALLHQAREFVRGYMARKKSELMAISYDDMLKMVHAALRGPGGRHLASILQRRYRVALIDEFQDTDAIQWRIFSTIYPDPAKSRLFLIGDPKQAIYSFRGADIFTYLEAKDHTEKERRWELDTNWRSAPGLVEGVNTIFSNQENPFLLDGIGFDPVNARDENDWRLEPASPGLNHPDSRGWDSPVELWLSLPRPDSGQTSDSNLSEGEELDPASLAASRIARLIDLGQRGYLKLTGPGGDEKPVGAGDIAVLVRSHRQAAEVRQALYDLGVYSIYYGPSNIFESTEARELLYILNAVISPYSQRAVSTALATAALGYNAQELINAQNDSRRWDDLVDSFMELRELWGRSGVAPMLRRLFHHFDVPKRLLSLSDGQRRLTNFRQLSELMAEAEKEFPGRSRLMLWLRKHVDDPGLDQDENRLRLETDENLVKVMTYHMSKGLEFPVVFLPYIGELGTYQFSENRFFSSKQGRYVLPVSQYGFQFDQQAEGGGYGVHVLDPEEERSAREQVRAEDVRLAYVALTRARYKMFLGLLGDDLEGSVMGELLLGTMDNGRFPCLSKIVENSRADGSLLLKDDDIEDDINGLPLVVKDALLSRTRMHDEIMEWCSRSGQKHDEDYGQNENNENDNGVDFPEGPELLISIYLQKLFQKNSGIRLVWQDELGQIARQAARIRQHREREEIIKLPTAPSGPVTRQTWTRTSFSGITAHDSHEHAGIIQHGMDVPFPDTRAISGFPRGAEAGSCIHQVFEDVDFREGTAAFRDEAQRALEQFNIDASWADVVSGMVEEVVRAELLPGLRLKGLDPERIVKEMEFHLPFDARFAQNLRGHEIQYEKGVIKGFIDLVFHQDGKFYLLDYKTNWLGMGPGDYTPENMRRAMDQHDYWLQAAIYAAALDTYLKVNMQGYERKLNFGGAFYLFVRGISSELSGQKGHGILFISSEELQARYNWVFSPVKDEIPRGGWA